MAVLLRWATPTQGPISDCPTASEEGPEGSPGLLCTRNPPELAAVLAAPTGVGECLFIEPAKEIQCSLLVPYDPHQMWPRELQA